MASSSVIVFFLLYIYLFGESGVQVDGCSFMTRKYYLYSEEWEGFYKVHYNTQTWVDARLTCYKEGATLAMPHSTKDTRILSQIISPAQIYGGIFIGGKEVESSGEYRTIEDVPLCRIPHEWAKNEPNNSGDSCLVLLQDSTLADKSCNETLPFVCYKKMDAECNACPNPCKTSDRGYKFEQSTGSCYKFHDVAKTWADSVITCADEGGHLVIINSETESAILKKKIAEYPPERITKARFTNYFFVGFHDLFKNGDHRNVDGKNLTESGYASWGPGEINRYGKACGGILRNGLMCELTCEYKYAFICEIESEPV